MNSGVVNTCMYTDLFESVFRSFGSMPRSGIAGSYGNSMFNILRSCQTYSPKKNFFFSSWQKNVAEVGRDRN